MLRIDDVFGNSGDGTELAGQHAAHCSNRRIVKRRQHVVEPGWVADQSVRGAEIDDLRTSGLTQHARERPCDIEVVTVIPEDADAVIPCRQFQRRDGRYGRIVDDQQFAGETARVERRQVLLDDRSRPLPVGLI